MWCKFVKVYICCNVLCFIIGNNRVINFCLGKFCIYKLIVFIDIDSYFKEGICIFVNI